MESIKNAARGRYSPPVSPRTVSTQPTPDLPIQGDDYFLDQVSSRTQNKEETMPHGRPCAHDEHPKHQKSSNNRQRPPSLHLTINGGKLDTRNSKPSHRPSQMLTPSKTKPLSAVSLDIRPFQELLNERSYLLHNLKKQDERATSLFRRYATLEAKQSEAQTAKEARKIRKEAKLLKHKITESTQQEQLIFLRLGEIYIETQNRERWMQFSYQQSAEFPRPAYFPPLFHGNGELAVPPPTPGVGVTYPATPYLVAQPSPDFSYSSSSALSPFSPDFVPGVSFTEDIWDRPGLSPRPSAAGLTGSPIHPLARHHLQNQVHVEVNEFPSTGSIAVPIPEEDKVKERQRPQDGGTCDSHQHGEHANNTRDSIVPWHELEHNLAGTATPDNSEEADGEAQSDETDEQLATSTSCSNLTGDNTTDDSRSANDDEETHLFKNYLRTVSVNSDVSPSAISPQNCYNWAVLGRGVRKDDNKRMSLPSLKMVWPRGLNEKQEDEVEDGQEEGLPHSEVE